MTNTSNELTDTQKVELSEALTALKASLEALLTSTESGTKPVKLKDNAGRLTRMDEMHNQSILIANRNVAKNRLKEVQAAMTRQTQGTYGYCVHCDETIAIARLRAYPEASMCLTCKSNQEQQ